MKIIDIILLEGIAGEASERVLKSVLGHAGWSSAQKIAFKDSVELLAKELYEQKLRDTTLSTRDAYALISQRLQGTSWIRDTKFVQEIFDVARKEADDMIASKAAGLKPSVAKSADEPALTTVGEKPPTGAVTPESLGFWAGYNKIVTLGIWGGNAVLVGRAVNDYMDAMSYAESIVQGKAIDTKTGKPIVWSDQNIKDFATMQHDKLVKTIALLILIPKVPMTALKIIRWLSLLPFKAGGSLAKLYTRISKGLDKTVEKSKPGGVIDTIVQVSDGVMRTIWLTFVGLLNAPTTWQIEVSKDSLGKPVYKEYTARELLAYIAMKYSIGAPISEAIFNIIADLWNLALQQATGLEATTMRTDLQRLKDKTGPAQSSANTSPSNAAPSNAEPVAPQQKTTVDGVEFRNWN